MKTPRELLLKRHQAASPKLDALRQSTVAAVYDRRPLLRKALVSTILLNIWRELIMPSRRIWAALAAVWILILAANLGVRDHSQTALAKTVPSQEIVLAFQQQQALLTQLIGQDEAPVAKPQKHYVPRPSSQCFFEIMTA